MLCLSCQGRHSSDANRTLLSSPPRADEIEMIMTDLERANQVGCYMSPHNTLAVTVGGGAPSLLFWLSCQLLAMHLALPTGWSKKRCKCRASCSSESTVECSLPPLYLLTTSSYAWLYGSKCMVWGSAWTCTRLLCSALQHKPREDLHCQPREACPAAAAFPFPFSELFSWHINSSCGPVWAFSFPFLSCSIGVFVASGGSDRAMQEGKGVVECACRCCFGTGEGPSHIPSKC